MRNVDGSFNKKRPIENTVEVNIYYKGHTEKTEIDVIGGQKWSVILGMLWLAHHNPEIDWKTGEIKMTRCLEECGRQWRPVEASARQIRVGKVERRRSKGGSGKKKGRERKEEETEKGEDSGGKESS